LANDYLGGLTPGSLSPGDVANAVDVLNNAFDECRVVTGFIPYASNRSITTSIAPEMRVTAFPNPYENGQFNLRITAPESGNALIQLFTIDGNKIAEFRKPLFANKEEILNVKVPGSIQKARLIYQVTLGKFSTKGFVLSPN
jgi:hypothetical protein